MSGTTRTYRGVHRGKNGIAHRTNPMGNNAAIVTFIRSPSNCGVRLVRRGSTNHNLNGWSPTKHRLVTPTSLLRQRMVFIVVHTTVCPCWRGRVSSGTRLANLYSHFHNFCPIIVSIRATKFGTGASTLLRVTTVALGVSRRN